MTLDAIPFNKRFLPYQLTDDQLLAIGKLLRLCAEIEEIVDVHLCNVAEISEGQMHVLLGQSSAARKVKVAEVRAKSLGKACSDAHKACFNHPEYIKLVRCRNAMAHGQMLGLTETNQIAILISEVTASDAETVAVKVRVYGHDDFAAFANVAAQLIPEFDRVLRTKALREKRREQFRGRAQPHQGSRPPTPKPQRPLKP